MFVYVSIRATLDDISICTFFVVLINTKCGYDDDDGMQCRMKYEKNKREMLHEQMNHCISNDINQCASMSRTEIEQTIDWLTSGFDCHFSERCYTTFFLFNCVCISRNVSGIIIATTIPNTNQHNYKMQFTQHY